MKVHVIEKNDDKISNIIPSTQKRIEEWAQNSQPTPPSNKKVMPKHVDNLEATSILVDEAINILNNRDEIIRARPGAVADNTDEISSPVPSKVEQESHLYHDHDVTLTDDGHAATGNRRFIESRMSARTYVREFEHKVKQKKVLASTLFNSFPPNRKYNFKSKIMAEIHQNAAKVPPVVEPDAWRHKASRSVRFSVKPQSIEQRTAIGDPMGADLSEDDTGEKWVMKSENDRDWWKWKLRQRFMQNDELLQKLASQRQKLESSFNLADLRARRTSIRSSKSSPTNDSSLTTISPFAKKNSSRHITMEIASQKQNQKRGNETNSKVCANCPMPSKTREPMPNFYTPSKQVFNMIGSPVLNANSTSTTATNKQKLKTLKKDPYLAKLLAGNEMFKPEMMLDVTQSNRRHELSQQFKAAVGQNHNNTNNNARRKISLESLTDSTDDEFTAAKFFNPDVKVLYERMSEMETNVKTRSRLIGATNSREPSDGFLNLPLLLATGRFNRYNKLPSVKVLHNEAANFRQTKKSENYRKKSQSQSPGSRKRFMSKPGRLVGVVAAAAAAAAIKDDSKNPLNSQKKVEQMSTKEWAKQLMTKMKTQNNAGGNKTDTDDSFVTLSDDDDDDIKGKLDTRLYNTDELLEAQKNAKRKYKVPIDQETNMLYHEILMSKWKKDKHEKDKPASAGQPIIQSTKVTKTKWKRGAPSTKKTGDVDKTDKIRHTKPRGLDIWLENIREKAKRDRLIAPLPNTDAPVTAKKTASSQPIVTTFNNAAFKVND